MNLSALARQHFRRAHHAVLGTLSLALPGYPFVSIVPYVLDEKAWPVLLISRLAEHTRNIAADPRVSLFTHEAKDDVQAGARVTLMGNARLLEEPGAVRERYFRFFPQVRSYHDTLDFDFYRIEPVTLRVVAGFARAHWLSREAYTVTEDSVASNQASIIDDLNRNYSRDLQHYAAVIAGAASTDVTLVGIDCEGFDVRIGEQIVRTDFETPCKEASDARQALLSLLTKPREGS